MKPAPIAVILVTHNFEPWLTRCLTSLRQQTLCREPDAFFTIAVDNASQDETVRRIRTEFPEVHVVANAENLGFGAANNQAIALAQQMGAGDVFLLNEDAWLDAEALETLRSEAALHPDAGILSPVHLDGTGTQLDAGFANFFPLTAEEHARIYIKECTLDVDAVKSLPPRTADFVNAAFWYLPASTLRTVGTFSPLFYHYGEDRDFVNRLHHHGLAIRVCPRAIGCHDRAGRPMPHDKYLRLERMYHLSVFADVRRSPANAFLYAIPAVWKKAFRALTRRQWHDVAAYLRISLDLLRLTPEVVKHRRRFSD